MTSTKHFLTVAEAAAFLNTSVRLVRRLVAERRVAFHRVGRHVRLAASDVEAFVRRAGSSRSPVALSAGRSGLRDDCQAQATVRDDPGAAYRPMAGALPRF
jgi:excisionase family DNA binding protein